MRRGERNAYTIGLLAEDFMLCKAESRDPAHCLKEGRKVTRCAQDLCVFVSLLLACWVALEPICARAKE